MALPSSVKGFTSPSRLRDYTAYPIVSYQSQSEEVEDNLQEFQYDFSFESISSIYFNTISSPCGRFVVKCSAAGGAVGLIIAAVSNGDLINYAFVGTIFAFATSFTFWNLPSIIRQCSEDEIIDLDI